MFVTFSVLFVLVTIAQCICPRQKLDVSTSRYITSQSTGQLSWIAPFLSKNLTYTENLVPTSITNSTLTLPLKIDHVHTIIDTTTCATFSELIISSFTTPFIIGAQINFDSVGTNITSIETIVTTTNDLFFAQYSPSHALHQLFLEDWSPIPPSSPLFTSRTTLLAAANAYYDFFTNRSVIVPWGTPCTRLEGGALKADGDCSVGMPPDPSVLTRTKERRWVVDETVGAVNGISNFGALGPDSHEFRVEAGRIVRIHAMTVCRPNGNCGLEMPAELLKPVGF